jgi:hypothetical protein
MKLYEFHVGETNTRAMGDGVSVAGRNLGIGRVPVHLAASAGRENSRVGDYVGWRARYRRSHAVTAAVTDNQIENACALEHFNALAVTYPVDQCARNLSAGLISVSVNYAPTGVCGFTSELELSTWLEVEMRSGGLQLSHARGALVNQYLDCLRVAQRRARGKRVTPVQLG